jgi:hypothetical protein
MIAIDATEYKICLKKNDQGCGSGSGTGSGTGSGLSKNAGSGPVINQSGSTTLKIISCSAIP